MEIKPNTIYRNNILEKVYIGTHKEYKEHANTLVLYSEHVLCGISGKGFFDLQGRHPMDSYGGEYTSWDEDNKLINLYYGE